MASQENLAAWQRNAPFAQLLGVKFVRASGGTAELHLPFGEGIENRKGNVHGGAIATLADMAMGHAIRSMGQGHLSVSTINLSVNYLEPGTGDLHASARCTRFGQTTCFADVQVFDETGKPVATGSGVFKLFRPSDGAGSP